MDVHWEITFVDFVREIRKNDFSLQSIRLYFEVQIINATGWLIALV